MNAVKHSGWLGVPARRLAVALSATSPRADYRAVGFPLRSLTRNAGIIKAVCVVVTAIILSGCAQTEAAFRREVFDDFKVLRLRDAIPLEKNLKSIDKTPKYLVTIGESIYPDAKKFELATPQTFVRSGQKPFSVEVEYFYTSSDSSVKAILYEWSYVTKEQEFSHDLPKGTEARMYADFQKKFDHLRMELTARLGQPTVVEINSGKDSDGNFRDGVKWINQEGRSAYLFLLGNNSNAFRRLRLAVY